MRKPILLSDPAVKEDSLSNFDAARRRLELDILTMEEKSISSLFSDIFPLITETPEIRLTDDAWFTALACRLACVNSLMTLAILMRMNLVVIVLGLSALVGLACNNIYRACFATGYHVKSQMRISSIFYLSTILTRICALYLGRTGHLIEQSGFSYSRWETDWSMKYISINDIKQHIWVVNTKALKLLVKQSCLVANWEAHRWKLSILFGIDFAIWQGICYLDYRRSFLGLRRQQYATYKPQDLNLDQSSSITHLKLPFEHSGLHITVTDQIKNFIQNFFDKPLIWWPLEPPQKPLLPGKSRLTRECVRHAFFLLPLVCTDQKQSSCRKEIQLDLPTSLTLTNSGRIELPRGFRLIHHSAGYPVSSTPGDSSSSTFSGKPNPYDGSASSSQPHTPVKKRNAQRSSSRKSGATGSDNLSGSGDVAINIGEPSSTVKKYVHWCVDSSKTHLHDICVESKIEAKKGGAFIKELLTSYKRLRGIRWWFSLTHCAEVKLVKVRFGNQEALMELVLAISSQFFRIVDNMELVSCLPDKIDVTRLLREKDYDFQVQLEDNEIHVRWVEESVAHYLTHHRQIDDSAIENLIAGIPKRVNSMMRSKARLTGYGMHARQGWSLIKFMIALAISECLGLAFFVYWLFQHPDDLQNAAVPNFMILAFIGIAVILPDIYIP